MKTFKVDAELSARIMTGAADMIAQLGFGRGLMLYTKQLFIDNGSPLFAAAITDVAKILIGDGRSFQVAISTNDTMSNTQFESAVAMVKRSVVTGEPGERTLLARAETPGMIIGLLIAFAIFSAE